MGHMYESNWYPRKGGQLVAALTCGALSGVDEGWRWMLGLALAPAVIQMLGFIFILPEVKFILLFIFLIFPQK